MPPIIAFDSNKIIPRAGKNGIIFIAGFSAIVEDVYPWYSSALDKWLHTSYIYTL